MKKLKLGIYMGSFNPPHKGHINVVNYLLKHHYVDKVLIVPTLNYWNKQDLVNIDDRINMLKYYENSKIKIDIKNNQYIYTIDLVKELTKEYLNYELSIIIGADNIIDFKKWKNYEELLKYHIIIMNRDNIDIKKYIKDMDGNFTVIDNYPYIKISSSMIRKNLSSKYLDKDILDYIKKHNLYKCI